MGLVSTDILFMVLYSLLYPYLYLTQRKKAILPLLLSSVFAIVWVFLAGENYGYNNERIALFGLNTFPLFAWAIGLFAIYIVYSYVEKILTISSFTLQAIVFIALYVVGLIFFEAVGYYVFDIKNVATGMYSSLPLCNCLHAPVWMQISYFIIGPVYFFICKLLRLENPLTKN